MTSVQEIVRAADGICSDILAIPLDPFTAADRRRITRAHTVARINRDGLRHQGIRSRGAALASIVGYMDDLLIFPDPMTPWVEPIIGKIVDLIAELREIR